jgi:hypothetical protein
MTPPIWVIELADRFWTAARECPPFPRDLTAAAMNALPLRIVSLPRLRLGVVRHWLDRLHIPCTVSEPDRPLRACLFARRGCGFVFLDAADPPDEQRFSLAHEIAHFLRDYDAPRRAVVEKLGSAVIEVCDGVRPATPNERLHALLRHTPLVAHMHLLHRDDAGRPWSPAEQAAETAADRLAFELLAPAALFDEETDPATIHDRLVCEFGLPQAAAAQYAVILCPASEIHPLVLRLREIC